MDQTYFFKNKELLTLTKTEGTLSYRGVLWNSVQNLKSNGLVVPVLAHREQDNLRCLLIYILVHHQNFPGALPFVVSGFTEKLLKAFLN